jgi:hypothetical protein
MFIPNFGFRILIFIFYPFRIPDPGVRKTLDPGSATLVYLLICVTNMKCRVLPLVPPVRFANILSIASLPPKDFTILNVASQKVWGTTFYVLSI